MIAEMARKKIFLRADHRLTIATTSTTRRCCAGPARATGPLNDFHRAPISRLQRKRSRAGVRFAMGFDAVYTMFGGKYARTRVVREGGRDSRSKLSKPRPSTRRNCWARTIVWAA